MWTTYLLLLLLFLFVFCLPFIYRRYKAVRNPSLYCLFIYLRTFFILFISIYLLILRGLDCIFRGTLPTSNPLSPSIIIKILLTGHHTFCWVLVRRTCWNIKTIHLWSFPQFSWPECVSMHWYDEKKFDADHHWDLKEGLKGWPASHIYYAWNKLSKKVIHRKMNSSWKCPSKKWKILLLFCSFVETGFF